MYSSSMTTTIVAPASVQITDAPTSIRIGEKYPLQAVVRDQNNKTISGINLVWTTSNNKAEIIIDNGIPFLAGLQTGTTTLFVHPTGYPGIVDSEEITILEAIGTLDVNLLIKTDKETFFPNSKISVANYDLTPWVKNPFHGYTIQDVSNITVAHAIASVFDNVPFESDLRYKDTDSDGLYIYKLPVLSGSVTTNYYGYGNMGGEDDYSCWMVKIGSNTVYKNLEDVILFQGDNVSVYYVDDINNNWSLTKLSCSTHNIAAGQLVELTLERETYFMYSGTTVMLEKSDPMTNQIVLIRDAFNKQYGEVLTTNGEGKVTVVIQDPGIYTVESAGESLTLDVSESTDVNTEKIEGFAVYPNPADQLVTIRALNLDGQTQLKVFSVTGEVVFERLVNIGTDTFEINASAWSSGVYVIQVMNGEKVGTRKVIIKH